MITIKKIWKDTGKRDIRQAKANKKYQYKIYKDKTSQEYKAWSWSWSWCASNNKANKNIMIKYIRIKNLKNIKLDVLLII